MMNQKDMLESIVQEVMKQMAGGAPAAPATNNGCANAEADYPLSEKRADQIKAPTGKTLNEITLEGVMDGTVTADDCKIRPETLELQAQIAESVGRNAFARNLRRAAELIAIPDERVLEIYNALRPYRSTKGELIAIADELENQYQAKINGAFVREAADLYEQRGRLKV
jgi:propanediol dehydratase small subunit